MAIMVQAKTITAFVQVKNFPEPRCKDEEI